MENKFNYKKYDSIKDFEKDLGIVHNKVKLPWEHSDSYEDLCNIYEWLSKLLEGLEGIKKLKEENDKLKQQLGYLDKECCKLLGDVARKDSEIMTLTEYIKSLEDSLECYKTTVDEIKDMVKDM